MSEQPPYQPPPQPPGPYGQYVPGPRQSSSRAVTALILGILGLLMCGPFTAIPAIIVGSKATREIDASQGRLEGRGMAQAGFVLGIIGTVLGGLALLFFVFLFVVGGVVSQGFSDSCDTIQGDDSSFTVSCD